MTSQHLLRLHGGLVLAMLSYVLSRSLCQVVAEASRKSSPTCASAFRTFTTSSRKCQEESGSASVVTYSQLKTMLSNRDIQLFDVRTPDEYQAGFIADAVNVPLSILEESLKLSPEQFQQTFAMRAPGKDDDNIVLYCKSGNRSAKAIFIAHQLGFNRARHYKGGYSEWTEREGI